MKILKFLKRLEKWEYYDPSSFWACILIGYFGFTTLFNHQLSFSNHSQIVIEEVRGGGQEQREVINSVNNLTKKKNFKEMQFKYFPDFESRIAMEKQQAIIYQKAVRKIREHQRLFPFLNNHQKWLTDEEKSTINYFHGTGSYAKLQDPKTPPNIFDTRKTFLKKMENPDMRKKFLETYNRENPIE
jgi:hypothetical protein